MGHYIQRKHNEAMEICERRYQRYLKEAREHLGLDSNNKLPVNISINLNVNFGTTDTDKVEILSDDKDIIIDEEFDAHFACCGAVDISPVLCPFGTDTVSLDTVIKGKKLSEVKNAFDKSLSRYDSVVLFFNDFSFEIPNEYSASKSYEKYMLGQPLSYKDTDVLKSQLLRMITLSASESQKEIMMFLPLAPDVRSMGEVSALLDYIDECGIRINATVYAGDAVSLCMAQSIAGKRYKNIIAATGVSGNGIGDIKKEVLTCWGITTPLLENRASLCKTAAGFIRD